MQQDIVSFLRCPLSGAKLTLQVVDTFTHPLTKQTEVYAGFLWSANGGCYPIINGIPRMLPDSFLVYSKQLKQWWPEFNEHKQRITNAYSEAIKASSIQSKKIQSTFGFEWNLLRKSDKLKIWNNDPLQFKDQLHKELQLPQNYNCELALDAGCGHGRSARLISLFVHTMIGVEVSPAVELAYEQNDRPNCHFIQADVHFLPFQPRTINLVYSSGVLHHNKSTKEALQKVALLTKQDGIICIWLYHPLNNWLHKTMQTYRSVTTKLPAQTVYYLNAITLTPLQWIISQVKGKKKKFTEISIEQLDMLTPAFRHEHSHEEVKTWLQEFGFANIKVTDTDPYGFSMKGVKE